MINREMKKYFILIIIFVILLSACENNNVEIMPTAVPMETELLQPPTITHLITVTDTPVQPTFTHEPTLIAPITPTPEPQIKSEQIQVSYEDRVIRGTLMGEGDKAVVLAHMFDRTRSSWMAFGKLIAAQGYTVLAFDFPGFGASTGEFSWTKVKYDVEAVIDYLEINGYESIVCMGASLGALGCFGAAVLRPDLDGLVIISDGLSTTTHEEAAALMMPKLYVRGDEPKDISVPMEKVYDLLPLPKQSKILSAKAHGTDLFQSEEGETLRDLLVQFLDEIR